MHESGSKTMDPRLSFSAAYCDKVVLGSLGMNGARQKKPTNTWYTKVSRGEILSRGVGKRLVMEESCKHIGLLRMQIRMVGGDRSDKPLVRLLALIQRVLVASGHLSCSHLFLSSSQHHSASDRCQLSLQKETAGRLLSPAAFWVRVTLQEEASQVW